MAGERITSSSAEQSAARSRHGAPAPAPEPTGRRCSRTDEHRAHVWTPNVNHGLFACPGATGEMSQRKLAAQPSRVPLWRGWNVWTKTECDHCGSRYKVTSGKPRNRVRQWIVVRFGR